MQRIGSTTASVVLAALLTIGNAHAQVIQLPTFRFFGLSTTVSVPDRGSAHLGGVSRSATSRSENGLPLLSSAPFAGRAFGNRATAGATELGGASVSAYIHDFDAMDEELLGQSAAASHRSAATPFGARHAPVVARSAAPLPRPSPAIQAIDLAGRTSVAELRRRRPLQDQASQAEGRRLALRNFERAKQLVASGQAGLAKVYLQQAARHADPQLRSEIAAMLQSPGVR
jgi:hypothetical protein